MKLHTRRWGSPDAASVYVCVHGVCQHGGAYEELARLLAGEERAFVAVDLRGHGRSGNEPPWDTETHVADLLETVDGLGVGPVTWIGHSFGGRVVTALASERPEMVRRLALLEPGLEVSPSYALKRAELDRLDWSFATIDGATAVMTGAEVPASAHAAVAGFVKEDVVKGPDGRLRFSFSPSAVVVAWNEMTKRAPGAAGIETLIVEAADAPENGPKVDTESYRSEFDPSLRVVTVPNGHNVLWEAPKETAMAIEQFIAPDRLAGVQGPGGLPG